MSIWGKVLGGMAGMALGGPLGLIIGAMSGHFFVDRKKSDSLNDANPASQYNNHESQSIKFTIAVVALAAKMAKADGRVTKDEIVRFRQLFTFDESDLPSVQKFYNLAKQDSQGFEVYAKQVVELFPPPHEMLEQLLVCLAHIAYADGWLHENEKAFLQDVTKIFNLDDAAFNRAMAFAKKTSEHGGHAGEQPLRDDLTADFHILGVSPTSDIAAIQAAHRKLVREYHPDHLLAKGLPTEFVQLANDKLAKINAAYDRIKKIKSQS